MRLAFALLGIAVFGWLGAAQPSGQPVPEAIIVQPAQTPLAIQLGFDKASYSPGDKLRLTIALNQEAYLYVYNITPDGRVNLLFPNAYQPVNLLRTGRHAIPDKRYSLVITPPTGLECIQVLALMAPLPIEQWLPQGKFSREHPFPQLSQQPVQFKQSVQQAIVGTVSQEGWTTVWSCFLIAKSLAGLQIISAPSGALVYLEGRVVGETPLDLELSPGRYEIKLVRLGYEAWTQRVTLKDKSKITLEANLLPRSTQPQSPTALPPLPRYDQPSIEKRPNLAREGPVIALGFNGGLSREQIPSFGFDFNWRIAESLRLLGVGISFLMTDEDPPPYEDTGRPDDLGPTLVYNEGPETEFYLKFYLGMGVLGLELSGGVAVQQEAHIAQPALWAQTMRSLDVIVKSNGYQTEKIYLTGLIGVSVRAQNLSLSVGMHNRRGWVAGIGVLF